MPMNISGPPWVVSIPKSAAQYVAAGADGRVLSVSATARLSLVAAGDLTHTLYPLLGPVPQFYRAALTGGRSYVRDHLGKYWQTEYGECLFWGARRVRNKLSSSNNFSASYWEKVNGLTVTPVFNSNITAPDGRQTVWLMTKPAAAGACMRMLTKVVYPATRHAVGIYALAGTATTAEIQIGDYTTPLGAKTVTLSSTVWRRIGTAGTSDGTTAIGMTVAPGTVAGAVAGTIYIAYAQLEEKLDGNDAVSEYVSCDESPVGRYYHGSAVDKVKCFNTFLGNTIDANGLITEATGASITGTMCALGFSSANQYILNNDVASGWTPTAGTTLTDNAALAPDGTNSMISINEGTGAATQHQATRTLTGTGAIAAAYAATDSGGEVMAAYAVFFKKGSPGARYMRLTITDTNANTLTAIIDLDTNTAGAVSNGTLNIEPPTPDGIVRGLWSVRCRPGAGSTDIGVRISMLDDAQNVTYTGTSRVNYFWLPCFWLGVASSSAAKAQRPIAIPPQKTGAAVSKQAGQAIALSIKGVVGRSDFCVISDFIPFYNLNQNSKKLYAATTSILTEGPTETLNTTINGQSAFRGGATLRDDDRGIPGKPMIAQDWYNGDPNPLWFWKPDTVWKVGDYVIPRDTQPNNENSRKVFTCVVPGLGGSSDPPWNTTFTSPPDTTSNLTPDGAARWQCNVPNGISGTYEPYNGAEAAASLPAFGVYRVAWYVTPDDYGMSVNGVEAVKQTTPRPVMKSKGYVWDYDPKTLFFGQIGVTIGQFPEAVPSGEEDAMCPPHCAGHARYRIYAPSPARADISAISVVA